MPSTGVRVQFPPDSASTVKISKTPRGIPGTGWSQVLIVVLSVPRRWVQGMCWVQILNPSYLSSPESVALSPQLEQKQLVCFSYCGMCGNATAAEYIC